VEEKIVQANALKPKPFGYIKRTWMLYLMLLLPLAFFGVFRYIPMTNIVIAFKNYNMVDGVWATPKFDYCDGMKTGIHRVDCESLTRIEPMKVLCQGETTGVHIPSCDTIHCGFQDYCPGMITGEHVNNCNDDVCDFFRYCHPGEDGSHETGCSHWVGFDWFKNAFGKNDFWSALRNTLMLNILDLLVGFPMPIILALLLNELIFKKFKRVTQTIIYLPHFLSWIIVSSIATRLLATNGGLINIFIMDNFGTKPINFLMDSVNWVATYITFGVWKEMGWGTIIYLAAITSINPELYEAAEVDGAGRWRKLWHITLPGIKATIIVLLIMNIGRILGIEFDRPFVMANPIVRDVSDVLSTLVYRQGIVSGQYAYTAAIGLFQSVICVIFLIAANTMAKRFGERGIW